MFEGGRHAIRLWYVRWFCCSPCASVCRSNGRSVHVCACVRVCVRVCVFVCSDTLHDLLLECMQTFLVLLSTQQDGKRRRVRTGTDGGHAVGGGGQNMGFALDHLVMNWYE